MLSNEFARMADPEGKLFNKKQKALLQDYIDLRKDYCNDNNEALKDKTFTALNEFFRALGLPQQTITKNWYSYQLTCIDSKILPSIKLSQFVSQCNLQDSLAVSSDGQSFMLLFDDQESVDQAAAKLKAHQPNIIYDVIKVNVQ
jgi:hypothetical protein